MDNEEMEKKYSGGLSSVKVVEIYKKWKSVLANVIVIFVCNLALIRVKLLSSHWDLEIGVLSLGVGYNKE